MFPWTLTPISINHSAPRFITEINDAARVFLKDLKSKPSLEDVCCLPFPNSVEEWNKILRRYGMVQPMFLVGGKLKQKVLSILCRPSELEDGDLKYKVDFKKFYATFKELVEIVGRLWLGINTVPEFYMMNYPRFLLSDCKAYSVYPYHKNATPIGIASFTDACLIPSSKLSEFIHCHTWNAAQQSEYNT